jgi:hypothetical protein
MLQPLPRLRPAWELSFQRVADLPERRRPETDEQSAPFSVAAFVLVDRLGTDPEADAEADRAQRERVKMGPA